MGASRVAQQTSSRCAALVRCSPFAHVHPEPLLQPLQFEHDSALVSLAQVERCALRRHDEVALLARVRTQIIKLERAPVGCVVLVRPVVVAHIRGRAFGKGADAW